MTPDEDYQFWFDHNRTALYNMTFLEALRVAFAAGWLNAMDDIERRIGE